MFCQQKGVEPMSINYSCTTDWRIPQLRLNQSKSNDQAQLRPAD